MSLTRKKLERFVVVRNKSGFPSNLQFQIDAESCGFRLGDLPKAEKLEDGSYRWATPFGDLTEAGGKLALGPDQSEQLSAVNKALSRAFGG